MINLCIIPARKGSKRITNKNRINFCDKPMIVWTIEAAIKSNCFDEVIVATDCEEIAEIALENGANVPFLRDQNVDDFSPISHATLSYLLKYEKLYNVKINTVTQAMANCPIRGCNEFKYLLKEFKDYNKSIISGFKYGMFNPWWAHEVSENICKPLFKKVKNARSQDLPKLLCPSGAIWISKWDTLKNEKSFYSKGYKLVDIGWKNAVDIDDKEDFELAEIVFKSIHNKYEEL